MNTTADAQRHFLPMPRFRSASALGGQRERGVPTMAYSPIEQARLLQSPKLKGIACDFSVTPAQLAIAWRLHALDAEPSR